MMSVVSFLVLRISSSDLKFQIKRACLTDLFSLFPQALPSKEVVITNVEPKDQNN